jgi:hypothetical protein
MSSIALQEDIEGNPGADIDLNIDPDHIQSYRDVDHTPLSKVDMLYRWYIAFCESNRALDRVLEVAHTQTEHTDLKIGVYLKDSDEFVDIQVWCDIQSNDSSIEEIQEEMIHSDRTRHLIFRTLFDKRINIRKVKTVSQDQAWALENQNVGSE